MRPRAGRRRALCLVAGGRWMGASRGNAGGRGPRHYQDYLIQTRRRCQACAPVTYETGSVSALFWLASGDSCPPASPECGRGGPVGHMDIKPHVEGDAGFPVIPPARLRFPAPCHLHHRRQPRPLLSGARYVQTFRVTDGPAASSLPASVVPVRDGGIVKGYACKPCGAGFLKQVLQGLVQRPWSRRTAARSRRHGSG